MVDDNKEQLVYQKLNYGSIEDKSYEASLTRIFRIIISSCHNYK
jgi:chorismate mutase